MLWKQKVTFFFFFFQKEKALGQPEGGSSREELSSEDITESKQLWELHSVYVVARKTGTGNREGKLYAGGVQKQSCKGGQEEETMEWGRQRWNKLCNASSKGKLQENNSSSLTALWLRSPQSNNNNNNNKRYFWKLFIIS